MHLQYKTQSYLGAGEGASNWGTVLSKLGSMSLTGEYIPLISLKKKKKIIRIRCTLLFKS